VVFAEKWSLKQGFCRGRGDLLSKGEKRERGMFKTGREEISLGKC